jgi:hypothetical protein
MVMIVMKVLMAMVMMMMMLMNPSSMAMTMATISPLREGISSADFCLRAFSLYVFSVPQRRRSLFAFLLPVLTFGETIYAKEGWQKWARAATPPGDVA